MAKVTQDLNLSDNAPNYLNDSKGTDKPKFTSSKAAFGELFKDVANIVPAATKAAYQGIDQRIRTGMEAAVDQVRTAFGVDAAVEKAATDPNISGIKGDSSNSLFDANGGRDPAFKTGRGTPAGVARLGNTMQSLQEAYQQGKLSETYYNARLMQIVKETKAANPGFSEEIDSHIQQITGINPANALRKSIQNDLDMADRARQASMSKDEAYVQQNMEYADAETRKAFITGDRSPQLMAKAKTEITNQLAIKVQTEAAIQSLNLQDKADTAYQQNATRVAGSSVNTYINGAMYRAFDGTAGSEGILAKIRGHDISKPWTTEELNSLRGEWGKTKTTLMLGVDQMLTRQEFIGMPQSNKDGIRKAAEERLNVIENALVNKEYGILASNENFVKGMQNANVRTLLENSNYFRMVDAIGSLNGGKEFLNAAFMNPNSTLLRKQVQAVNDLEKLQFASGQPITEVVQQRMSLAKKEAKEGSPEAYTKLITDAATGIAKAPLGGIAENHAKSLFGPGNESFWAHIDDASKPRVYGLLTSPDVTKKMLEIKGSQPELYQQYQRATVDGFNVLLRSKLQDLTSEARDSNSLVKIDYNQKTNQFEAVPLPGKEKLLTTPGPQQAAYSALVKQMADVNRGLTTLVPVLKGGDGSVSQTLKTVFEANGWKDGAKDPTMLQRMGDAIKGFFMKERPQEGVAEGGATATYEFAGLPAGKSLKSDYSPSQRDTISTEPRASETGAKGEAVKKVIREAEASGDYNAVFGSVNKIPLTKMSLNEVMALQGQMQASGSPSTAVGGYQFLNRTLVDLKQQLNLTGKEQFDDALQDKMADALLHKRGWSKYIDGKITHKQLVDSLAKEWAGLPNTSGQSHYAGDGLNRSTVKLRAVLDALKTDDQQAS